MYTMEYHDPLGSMKMDILDPDGDIICTVENEWQARALLTHLNRG
jgi:hypothetical protein